MRFQPKAPLAGAILAGFGLSAVAALPSEAADPPQRLFFHSGTGTYQDDALADPAASVGGRAPAEATLTRDLPLFPDSATATTLDVFGVPGSPIAPTFPMPDEGTLTSVCVDIWAEAPSAGDELSLHLYLQTGNTVVSNVDGTYASFEALTVPNGDGIVRMTGIVKTPEPYELAPETTLSLIMDPAEATDFTLYYDSTVHYSSITLNPKSCVAGPMPDSVDDEPSAAPTASESASTEPTGEPTDPPSETPSVQPTTQPTVTAPAMRDSEVAYTGPASARYGDMVTFSAVVKDEAGLPVSGGKVTFALGRTTYTAEVGSGGKASISGRVNEVPDTYVLETRYTGANGLRPSASQDGLTVAKGVSVCSLQRGASSTNSTLIGVLSRPDTSRITNAPVTFLHQNRSVATARTDTRGVARTETAPKGRAGDVFSVTYAGDSFQTGCRKDLKI